MKTYTIIHSESTRFYYIYSAGGHLLARCASLAEVSLYIHKIQDTYQFRTVIYSNTCSDDVILVTLK